MKLKDFAAKLESSLKSIFPNSYLKIEYSEGIWESVSLWFTKEPKEQWTNNIMHNASYIIFTCGGEKQKEKDSNPNKYKLMAPAIGISNFKIRAKTGNLDQIHDYIVEKFRSLV